MADRYVDFGAANDGDGTAYTQAGSGGAAGAYNTLSGKTFSSGDKVWIRRVAKTGQTATWSQSVAGVIYIGWPISGDKYYASRPDGGAHAAWDGDSDQFASVAWSSGTTCLNMTGACEFHRLHLKTSVTSVTYIWNFSHSTNFATLYHCKSENTSSSTSKYTGGLFNMASPVRMYDCTAISAGGTSSKSGISYGVGFWLTNSNVARSEFHRCAYEHPYATSFAAAIGHVNAGPSFVTVVDFSITGAATPSYGFQGMGRGTRVIGGTWKGTIAFGALAVAGIIIRGAKISAATQFFVGISTTNADIHFVDSTQTAAATAISSPATGFGRIVLDSCVFHASSTYNFVVGEGYVQVLMRNCTNIKTPANDPTGTDTFRGYFSTDHNGTQGLFKFVSAYGEITSSSVFRTGGEAFSLKLESLDASGKNTKGSDVFLGQPGFETIWVELVAGANTITLYGAHKLFASDPPLADDIWMEVDYMDQAATDASRVYAHSREKASLTSDASSWDGDTDLTPFKIELEVTAGQDCVVPVRIGYGKYVASAYTYIDPKLVVT